MRIIAGIVFSSMIIGMTSISYAESTDSFYADPNIEVPLYCSAAVLPQDGEGSKDNLGDFVDEDARLVGNGVVELYKGFVVCNGRSYVTFESANDGLLSTSSTGDGFGIDDTAAVFAGRSGGGDSSAGSWYLDYEVVWSWGTSASISVVTNDAGFPEESNIFGPVAGDFVVGVNLITGTNAQNVGGIPIAGLYTDVLTVTVEAREL